MKPAEFLMHMERIAEITDRRLMWQAVRCMALVLNKQCRTGPMGWTELIVAGKTLANVANAMCGQTNFGRTNQPNNPDAFTAFIAENARIFSTIPAGEPAMGDWVAAFLPTILHSAHIGFRLASLPADPHALNNSRFHYGMDGTPAPEDADDALAYALMAMDAASRD